MNILELFEKTLKSSISAFYDFIRIVVFIPFSPTRGPIITYRRWKADKSETIGPQAFKFLCGIVIGVAWLEVDYDYSVGQTIFDQLSNKSADFPSSPALRIVGIAILFYIIADITVQWSLTLNSNKLKKRQFDGLRAVYQYSISAWSASLACLSLISVFFGAYVCRQFFSHSIFLILHQWVMQISLLAAALFALLLIRRNFENRRLVASPRKIDWARRRHLWPQIATVCAVIYSCTQAPYSKVFRAPNNGIGEYVKNKRIENFRPAYVSCRVANRSIGVNAVFVNDSSDIYALDWNELGVIVTQGTLPGYGSGEYSLIKGLLTMQEPPHSETGQVILIAPKSSLAIGFTFAASENVDRAIEKIRRWKQAADKGADDDEKLYSLDAACALSYAVTNLGLQADIIFPDKSQNIFDQLDWFRFGRVALLP